MNESEADAAHGESASGGASTPTGLSRRGLLGLAIGGSVAGLAVGTGAGLTGGVALGRARAADDAHSAYDFFGEHQAGITTPVQDHLHFASFDMMPRTDRDDLISLLQDWSYAASRMAQGLEVSATGAVGGPAEAPPDDTGEALGLPAAGLTITFGFGPGLFENEDGDRYGIAAQRPAGLERLPAFLGDDLDPQTSHGDLCVQACADDPQVAVHAIRNLSRIAFGDTEALRDHVWVAAKDEPAWLAGGSYLVARKIAMLIETWDRVRLSEQDTIIGRDKGEGAPLSGGDEFTAPDFHGKAIDANSHVSLAHPEHNDGIRILRRGYNYVDGNNELGRLDAGLFFLSYQRDPAQFIALQRRLSTDLMNEYIRHVGSGIWAVPAGASPGSYVGAALFS